MLLKISMDKFSIYKGLTGRRQDLQETQSLLASRWVAQRDILWYLRWNRMPILNK